jgi:putative membrane protein
MKRLLPVGVTLCAAPAHAHVPTLANQGAEPWLVGSLIVAAGILYLAGLLRLWPHSQHRNGLLLRTAAFTAGSVALAALLLGPLDQAAPRSFAVHMLQHEGLMLIAAPLLVLGRAMPLFLWSLPHGWRLRFGHVLQSGPLRGLWQLLSAPLSAWLLHAAALWSWHAPALFNAALREPVLHHLQHFTFLATAVLFWHAVLRRGSHGAQGMALLYLFTTTIHTGVLGALLTLARRPLYVLDGEGLTSWFALTPLEDQQLGGLIMWVPGALVYVGSALWLLARWIGPERKISGAIH